MRYDTARSIRLQGIVMAMFKSDHVLMRNEGGILIAYGIVFKCGVESGDYVYCLLVDCKTHTASLCVRNYIFLRIDSTMCF